LREIKSASLYIHIPFCAACCDYCDFFSLPVKDDPSAAALMDAFISTVIKDTEYQLDFFGIEEIPTVYIGGGTPSVLGAGRMERLLSGLGTLLARRKPPVEFTVEANPESADEDFLRTCLEGGANRLSLGIQTFHEPSRRAVNRFGDVSLLEERLALVSRYFPGNFSVDLITGLPFQTENIVINDIERVLVFKPAHVSLYSLTLEPETVLAHNISGGAGVSASMPDADTADTAWLAGRDALLRSGYAHYEISNFSLPGKRCAHNIRYWRMENWLGAGPSASGTIISDESGTGRRYTHNASLPAYLNSVQPLLQLAAIEELDKSALIKESILMGYRYCEGPDKKVFKKRFALSVEECIGQTIGRWTSRGFFNRKQGENEPVPNGKLLLFLDSFLRETFTELERRQDSIQRRFSGYTQGP